MRIDDTRYWGPSRQFPKNQTYFALFPQLNSGASSSTPHNPTVVTAVWLPDGGAPSNSTRYKFYYNVYGELARVELPTGGAYEYDWKGGFESDGDPISGVVGDEIYRRMVERRVYPEGGTGNAFKSKMVVGKPANSMLTDINVVVDYMDKTGTELVPLAHHNHHYHGNPGPKFNAVPPYTEPGWKEGKEHQTDLLDVNGTTVLRRVSQAWLQRAPVSWWTGNPDQAPPNDPRLVEAITTLYDTNQVSKQTSINPSTGSVGFDQYNNPTEVWEYDYGPGEPGNLLRHTRTQYMTSGYDTVVGTPTNPDQAATIHIRNLPTSQAIYSDAETSNKMAETTYEYDNYTPDTGNLHDELKVRNGISGLCDGSAQNCPNGPNFTLKTYTNRGNVTKISRWLNTPSGAVNTYQQYDVAGNVIKVIDPRSTITPLNIIATTFDFSDRFGSPDDDAQQNTPPTNPNWLNGQTTYAFATKVTNALGHIAYTQYDYFIGKPVNSEDANGIVSSVAYNDLLDRPTQGIQARWKVGIGMPTAIRQTTFTYDNTNRTITTTSDRDTFNDNILTAKSYYDGLGRTWRGAGYEGSTWTITDTRFDAPGRVSQVSNPYRATNPGTASAPAGTWTTTDYDALGRVIKVTTPDTAHVDTAYNGNQVTVTDQAGKKRRSETDALGRLTKVTEDPDVLSYDTSYLYDALGNLRLVNLGGQFRWFSYDSLSRLIRVRNLEQDINGNLPAHIDPLTGGSGWSTAYSYDANGNLTQRIDARGITTNYFYDALNRNSAIDYLYGTHSNYVRRVYDGAVNGKGRSYYDWTQEGSTNVAHMAIDSYDALGRPLTKRQHFWRGADWGPAYSTQRTYDRVGNIKTQTYPSGRTTNYSYNTAGQLTGFSGTLGDGLSRTYATITQYNPAGQIERESYGTGTNGMTTPLYLKLLYNKRHQLADLRLGSVNDAGDFNRGWLQFFYGLNGAGIPNPLIDEPNNNGNLVRQWGYAPKPGGGVVTTQLDDYTYDSLNRLATFTEGQINESGTFVPGVVAQNFAIDRYGNRRVTSATGGVSNYNPTYDTTYNNNRIVGLGYDAAGNITSDPLTGGTMTFDAENRLLTATNGGGGSYTYYAEGKRVKRITAGQEWWYVYGIGGELVAEYLASAPATMKKEYGYRGGQMLVVWNGDEPLADKKLKWLVTDHLGSTRMEADKSGSLAGITRHDYAPFGEEMYAGIRRNGSGQGQYGYEPPQSNVRQKFGSKERDNETGLDYFLARYYSNTQGRFNSVDPGNAGAMLDDPQSWNGYIYTLNSPLVYTDPDGKCPTCPHKTYVDLADASYTIKTNESIGGWKAIRVFEPGAGYRGVIFQGTYKGNTEYIFATAGTGGSGSAVDTAMDVVTDASQLVGASGAYQGTVKLARYLAKNYPGISFTGHSLGGGQAAANALAVSGKAVTFNGAGLSDWTKIGSLGISVKCPKILWS